MPKILIADLKQGASRLTEILSQNYDLFYAKTVQQAIEAGSKQKFDAVIIGILFDFSSMFELIQEIRKNSNFAEAQVIGFSDEHTDMTISGRNATEMIMHLLGGSDYIDTQNMSDREILDRIETCFARGSAIQDRSVKELRTPTMKRVAQEQIRTDNKVVEAARHAVYQVLVIADHLDLYQPISESLQSISNIEFKIQHQSLVPDALTAAALEPYDAIIYAIRDRLSFNENALKLLAPKVPLIAVADRTVLEELKIELPDAAVSFLLRDEIDGLRLAVALVNAIAKAATSDRRKLAINDFLLAELQRSLIALKTVPLTTVLYEFCSHLEQFGREKLSDDFQSSILLVDPENGTLRACAAPSLPDEYSKVVDGVRIEKDAGSCGSAAYLGSPAYVFDINTDPRWTDFRQYAEPFGLRSCWSVPVFDNSKRVIATLAIYHKSPSNPDSYALHLMGAASANLSALLEYAKTFDQTHESAHRFPVADGRFRSLDS